MLHLLAVVVLVSVYTGTCLYITVKIVSAVHKWLP